MSAADSRRRGSYTSQVATISTPGIAFKNPASIMQREPVPISPMRMRSLAASNDRAVALWAQRQSVDSADMHRMEQLALAAVIELEPGNSRVLLNGEEVSGAIRAPEIAAAASVAAAIPGVRRALVEKQRAMSELSSVVMEGRDIGSVVFPDADIKIFLDAD